MTMVKKQAMSAWRNNMENKKAKSSIMEFNGGAILERIDLELDKVLKNIADLNTDPVKPRKIKKYLIDYLYAEIEDGKVIVG